MRWVLLAFIVVSSGCGRPPCAVTCGGCCDENDECQAGTTAAACGQAGDLCRQCSLGAFCFVGACNTPSSGSGGGAVGGGTAGGLVSVGGGLSNPTGGGLSSVGGGLSNPTGGGLSSVGGGLSNPTGGGLSSVGGGLSNPTGGGAPPVAGGFVMSTGGGSAGGTPMCVETDLAFCTRLGKNCGQVIGFDRCGASRSVVCGACGANQTCTPSQTCCTKTTCSAQGKNCGTIADGCGGSLNCGYCNGAGESCGGTGLANVCGCVPSSCAAQSATCGTVSDGCGRTLNCGSCSGFNTCGGGTAPRQCGCTRATCASLNKNCGTVSDGCGGTLQCGSCPSGQQCGFNTQVTNRCLRSGQIVNANMTSYTFALLDPLDQNSSRPCYLDRVVTCINGERPVPNNQFLGYCKPNPTSTTLTSLYSGVYCQR